MYKTIKKTLSELKRNEYYELPVNEICEDGTRFNSGFLIFKKYAGYTVYLMDRPWQPISMDSAEEIAAFLTQTIEKIKERCSIFEKSLTATLKELPNGKTYSYTFKYLNDCGKYVDGGFLITANDGYKIELFEENNKSGETTLRTPESAAKTVSNYLKKIRSKKK